MIKNILLLSILISISIVGFSQESKSDASDIFVELQNNSSGGTVKIYESPTIRIEMEKHLKSFAKKKGVQGYRVQIFFGSSKSAKRLANNARVKFISTHSDIKAHINYKAPYFKVRVGDYREQSDAIKLLNQIKVEYPEAFVVKDIIDIE